MENKTALSAGVTLNAYPDSMGGTLADIVALLGRAPSAPLSAWPGPPAPLWTGASR